MRSGKLTSPTPEISEADWQRTPVSVQRFIVEMVQRLAQLEEQVRVLEEKNRLLEERLGSDSQNSSKPPSSDGPEVQPRPGRGVAASQDMKGMGGSCIQSSSVSV